MTGAIKHVDPAPQQATSRPSWIRSTAWLVVPAVLFLMAAFGYPILKMFHLSFVGVSDSTAGLLGNYRWYFTDETQMTILLRTFRVSLWVTVVALVLGFPYAYLMTIVGRRARLVMTAAVLLPFWSNLVVRTYAWVILLQDSGPVQAALEAAGIEGVRLIGNMTGVTIGAVQVLLPFLVLPLYSSLAGIDRRLLDAAESLGATPRSAFVRIYLPQAVPGILAGSLIVFVLTLGFYFTPALLGSPTNSLIAQQIVLQVSRLLEFGRGGAMALVLLVATLACLAAAGLLTRRQTSALGMGEQE